MCASPCLCVGAVIPVSVCVLCGLWVTEGRGQGGDLPKERITGNEYYFYK